MIYEEVSSESRTRRTLTGAARVLSALSIKQPLVTALALTAAYGLVVLYSASAENMPMVLRTAMRLVLGTAAMLALARVSPNFLRRISPWLYGHRRFPPARSRGRRSHAPWGAALAQPRSPSAFSRRKLMKLAVPMMCAWYLHERPLPPRWPSLLLLGLIILAPAALVTKEPDLGTAALIAAAGALVPVLAGLRVRVIVGTLLLAVAVAWFGLRFMHGYQRERLLTFLNPQSDPLGAGYHIIQSQIAIGSGRRVRQRVDEWQPGAARFPAGTHHGFHLRGHGRGVGLLGLAVDLLLYTFIIGRALYLAVQTPDTFFTPARGQHRADLLRVCVHQRRNGHRAPAGCRCARCRSSATGEARW